MTETLRHTSEVAAPLSPAQTLAVCSALLVEGMSASSINVQVGVLRQEFALSPGHLHLVAGAFLVAYAGFLPVAGRLVDVRDKRRVFQLGILLFSAGCVLCAAAWDPWSLIAGRAVQGAAAALSTPAAFALITTGLSSGAARNRAVGIFSAMGSVGFTLGLVLPGLIVAQFGWRLSFLLYLPLTIAVLLKTRGLGQTDTDSGGSADVIGAFAVTAIMILVVSAVGGVGATGNGLIAAELAGAGVLGLVYLRWARRTGRRMIPREVLGSRWVIAICLSLASVFAGIVTSMYLLSLTLQLHRGYDAFDTGLALVPQSIANAASAAFGAWLVTRYGATRVLATGMTMVVVGLGYLGLVGIDRPYLIGIMPAIIVIGVGVAMSYPAASIAAVDRVSAVHRGVTSGLLVTFQNLGGAVGLALATAAAVVPVPGQADSGAAGMLVSAGFLVVGGLAALAIGYRTAQRPIHGER